MSLKCDSCGKEIPNPQASFRMKIQLYADPSPPVFTEEDLERDPKAEMKELIEKLEEMDPQEAEDEVYEAYVFVLCGRCRKVMHEELKGRRRE